MQSSSTLVSSWIRAARFHGIADAKTRRGARCDPARHGSVISCEHQRFMVLGTSVS
jgi:hypothetical protein